MLRSDLIDPARVAPRVCVPLPVFVEGACLGWVMPGGYFAPKSELGAITTWDGVCAARFGTKYLDAVSVKTLPVVVAYCWTSLASAAGIPQACGYSDIPGGATLNRTSAGAIPVPAASGSEKTYVLSVTSRNSTNAVWTLLIDLLCVAGNISTATTASQTVNTAALTRYTDGLGVMMTLEVTAALSTTPSNVTIGYTGANNGASQTTGAIAMTTSCIVGRLQPFVPRCYGPAIPLAAGDCGVKSVETIQFSASMGGSGKVAVLLYRPLALFYTRTLTGAQEPSTYTTAEMLDGLIELTKGSDGHLGCLTSFVLPSSTQVYSPSMHIRTCFG